MTPVNNPKMMGHQTAVAPPANNGSDPPTGQYAYTVDRGEFMTRLLKEMCHRIDTDQYSLAVDRVRSNPAVEHSANRSEVRNMTEKALDKLTD